MRQIVGCERRCPIVACQSNANGTPLFNTDTSCPFPSLTQTFPKPASTTPARLPVITGIPRPPSSHSPPSRRIIFTILSWFFCSFIFQLPQAHLLLKRHSGHANLK